MNSESEVAAIFRVVDVEFALFAYSPRSF